MIKNVQKDFGGIDVLVNNAGISKDQLLPFAKESDFDETLNLNLKSAFLLSKLASKIMIRKKSGVIINISSVVGFTGNKGQSLYSASKSALTGFMKSCALDLAGFGIRVNNVAPGFIETDMTKNLPEEAKSSILKKIPLGRMGSPEEIAHAVHFLASEQASYITGTTIHVNGGLYM
jgi:3-oxoacyl-[acyl-carrier protein] reductase